MPLQWSLLTFCFSLFHYYYFYFKSKIISAITVRSSLPRPRYSASHGLSIVLGTAWLCYRPINLQSVFFSSTNLYIVTASSLSTNCDDSNTSSDATVFFFWALDDPPEGPKGQKPHPDPVSALAGSTRKPTVNRSINHPQPQPSVWLTAQSV